MDLILRVVGWPEHVEAAHGLAGRFDGSGGLIGRAETARLSLPDPRRTVSRFHAHVSCTDGAYFLEDMGSINAATVNDRPLAPSQKLELRPGDRIRIADYLIAVEFDDADFPTTVVVEAEDSGTGSTMPMAEPLDAAERTQLAGRALAANASAGLRIPATSDELWRAFQQGARVQVELPYGLRPEMMHTIGAMLRSLVGGLRRLVLLRTEAKQEVDAEVTQLRPRNNNPLKFATDDTRALASLLKPPAATFLPGPQAVDDAMSDIAFHSAATMTAMRVASERTLRRFEPAALESRLSRGGMLDSLLPMSRKARLWDLFLEQYRTISDEAQEGFREAFEHAFTEAYEAEVARLKRSQSKPATRPAPTGTPLERPTRPR
jgi:predicted component of type VI protein secretion system